MSYLLFMDESGHDHKNTPYEVRGGVSINIKDVSLLLSDIKISEEKIFGCVLSEYKTEFKGSKLLEKNRFKWSNQAELFVDNKRQKHCRRFLDSKLKKRVPTRDDFTAYGQASLKMVDAIISLMFKYNINIFAGVIKKMERKPKNYNLESFLRKDHIFLFERFGLFLKENKETGLLIMDQVEKEADKKFTKQINNYFTRTNKGKELSKYIVSEPLFIESEMNYLIQVADLCIYIINWGYRKSYAMIEDTRKEIQNRYEDKIKELEFKTKTISKKDGKNIEINIYGISLTNDPYFMNKKKR